MTRDITEHAWHETHDNIVALCRWLVKERDFDAEELLGVLAKPWNWGKEYQEMQAERSQPC